VSRRRGLVLGLLAALAMLVLITGASTAMLGLGAFEWQRWRSAAREDALLVVAQQAVRRGHAVDATLYQFEGLLTGLAYTAEVEMAGGHRGPATYEPGAMPPGAKHSEAYDAVVSLTAPDLTLVDARGEGELGNLANMGPYMLRALLHSGGDAELSDADLRDKGAPAAWVHVATGHGARGVLPGRSTPTAGDPRKELWFKLARKNAGPQWGPPYKDPRGQGWVMPVSQALRAPSGGFAGAAAIDLRVEAIAALLEPPTPSASVTLMEVAKGRVVLASTSSPTSRTGRKFSEPEVLAALTESPESGFVEFYGDDGWQFAAWSGLRAMPWAYVVVAPSSELYMFGE
jgi:hypothetical protein